ncbi:MAG: hypothetical protein Q8O99_03015 [bacterium]|nr:hypothetical protein [bacterium]
MFLYHQNKEELGQESVRALYKRLALSGTFYAMAAFAKPTAMFDVLNF